MTKRLISILLFGATLCFLADTALAVATQTTPGVLEFFSSSQFSLLPPFAGEPKSATSQPSKSVVLLHLGQNGLTVKTQYFEQQPGDAWKGLSIEDRKQGQLSALATSSIIDHLLTAEGEWAYSSLHSRSLVGLGDGQNRLLRFGVKGGWADFIYGAEYRSVGKDFVSLAPVKFAGDQQGGELWAQQKFGMFTAKASLSNFTNNVARDPAVARITKMQRGASVSIAPPSRPVLSLFYTKGSLASSSEPAGAQPQRGSLDSAGAALSYKAAQWDTTLSSTYSFNDVMSRLGKSTDGRLQLSRVKTDTPLLSLGLNYRPSILPVQINTLGSYTKTKTSDGCADNNAFNLSASLAWKLGQSNGGKNILSLGASYKRYLDNVNPSGSNKDVSVWMRLNIAAF